MSAEKDWTFWLNVTNVALALVVLGSGLIVGITMFWEYLRAKAPQPRLAAGLEDSHSMLVPELGLTMADGGEKTETSHKELVN